MQKFPVVLYFNSLAWIVHDFELVKIVEHEYSSDTPATNAPWHAGYEL
jgi:hypothetical protein